LIGKQVVVPEEAVLGRNVVVHALATAKDFGKRKKVVSGGDVGKNPR
jgi:hypothetical protein